MSTDKKDIDYSLYLVTGRELLPAGKDYYESLEESVRDGKVTVVQLREKTATPEEFLEIAKRSLEICDKYNVPMLINDNLSVALALPEHVGLHIGQDDLPVEEARKRLGPKRLLGLSVHSVEQARAAYQARIVDYVGVGPVYGTKSKAGIEDKDVLGPRGARAVVEALVEGGADSRKLPCVLIGGLNQKTALRSLFGATSASNRPDGIAVISAIVGQQDPAKAAGDLSKIVTDYFGILSSSGSANLGQACAFLASESEITKAVWLNKAAELLSLRRSGASPPPLIQTLTSHVSSTLSANIALAFNASPIMSHQEAEAEDLGKVVGAVVLNIGTIGEEARRGMRAVGASANSRGKPVVLDPVGVGASAFRKNIVNEILDHTQVTLLKGNAAELSTIAGLQEVESRGVDSGSGTLSDPEGLVRALARRERCLVLMTGKVDYLSDGQRVAKIHNGHPLVGRITGSGCALGVVVAAGLATGSSVPSESKDGNFLSEAMVKGHPSNLFAGALMAVLALTIASEKAAGRADVHGPGSFIPAFIDEIAAVSPEDLLERANFEVV